MGLYFNSRQREQALFTLDKQLRDSISNTYSCSIYVGSLIAKDHCLDDAIRLGLPEFIGNYNSEYIMNYPVAFTRWTGFYYKQEIRIGCIRKVSAKHATYFYLDDLCSFIDINEEPRIGEDSFSAYHTFLTAYNLSAPYNKLPLYSKRVPRGLPPEEFLLIEGAP